MHTVNSSMQEKRIYEKWHDQETQISCVLPREFSMQQTLFYLTRSINECLHRVRDGKVYKLILIEDEQILIEVSVTDDHRMNIAFINGTPSPSQRGSVALYVWDWLDLGTDLTGFYQMAELDPILNKLMKQFYGLRITGIPDLFEALCWAIMGQQINLAFAYSLKKRFVESFGTRLAWEGQPYWLFPTTQDIAMLTVEALMKLQLTRKKAEYILDLAKLMERDELSKQQLLAMEDFKAAEKAMVRIRGIGPWTANYVMMRCLRDKAAFPLEDVGLHNALKLQLQLEQKPTLAEIRQHAIGWVNWEAYATFYLWRSLD
ncbi:MAG: DNA-3-methyladenine glycosylase [Paenibacillaceae bacterium]